MDAASIQTPPIGLVNGTPLAVGVSLSGHTIFPDFLPVGIEKRPGSPYQRSFYILKFRYMRAGNIPATGVILMSAHNTVMMDTCLVYTMTHIGPLQTIMEKALFDSEAGTDQQTREILWHIDSAEILMTTDTSNTHVVVVGKKPLHIVDAVLNNTKSIYDEFSVPRAHDAIKANFRPEDFGTFADVFLAQLNGLAAQTPGNKHGLNTKFVWRKRECPFGQGLNWAIKFATYHPVGEAPDDEDNGGVDIEIEIEEVESEEKENLRLDYGPSG